MMERRRRRGIGPRGVSTASYGVALLLLLVATHELLGRRVVFVDAASFVGHHQHALVAAAAQPRGTRTRSCPRGQHGDDASRKPMATRLSAIVYGPPWETGGGGDHHKGQSSNGGPQRIDLTSSTPFSQPLQATQQHQQQQPQKFYSKLAQKLSQTKVAQLARMAAAFGGGTSSSTINKDAIVDLRNIEDVSVVHLDDHHVDL